MQPQGFLLNEGQYNTSAAQNKINHEEGFPQPVPSQCWQKIENANFFIYMYEQMQHWRYQSCYIQSSPQFGALILWCYQHRDHSVYVPSQWEMLLQCNTISHWLGAYRMTPTNILTHMNLEWAFIKPDQLDPWVKDQQKNTLMSTILQLCTVTQFWVLGGKACPSCMSQNLVTVVGKVVESRDFPTTVVDPWSMDQAEWRIYASAN